MNCIHNILIKRNIYYEDVLEKRRSERIKNKLAEINFELKVNRAETLFMPAQKFMVHERKRIKAMLHADILI